MRYILSSSEQEARDPQLAGRVEAWNPLPGLRLVIGTPDAVRAEVRRDGLRGWLAVLGRQGQQ